MRPPRRERRLNETREAAGNGLLDRRAFLAESAGALATGAFMAFAPGEAGAAGPPETPTEMKVSGAPLSAYGAPATFEGEVTRTLIRSQPGTTGAGASRTPLEALEGIITPSGLHFERHHNGVPAIDPAQHQLLIHGKVARPLIFTVASLLRYPMVSRIHFLECSGNSGVMYQPTPPALTCGQTLPLPRDPGLARGVERRGEECLRVRRSSSQVSCSRGAVARAGPRRKRRISDAPRPPLKSRAGTSASLPMGAGYRPAAGRQRKAHSSTPRSARPATEKRA